MGTLSVIFWRDIPAQVVGREGRRSSKIVLHPRFQIAIDKAANRAGKRGYNEYIEEWRKVHGNCGPDIEDAVRVEAERLESQYTKHRLAALILAGGIEAVDGAGPAVDPTDARPASD
ncbi:MAG: virulence factor [Chloroflexota bacterium]|nr:virulence factor [Chloroflexota bacterium]